LRIGILGTGDVGRTLGSAFIQEKHEVMMGSRSADNEGLRGWVKENGPRAAGGTFPDAAKFGEVIVLATRGVANGEVIRMAGPGNFEGKIVVDATNPLDFSVGFPPRLAVGHTDSGGEEVQRLLPRALVVKAFNTVGNAHMFRPSFPGGPPDMFICGNDEGAKERVGAILKDFGWGVVDVGGIESSRYLEAMCMVWVLHGIRTNSWNHAFKLLRK
jgi:hypothetical protein